MNNQIIAKNTSPFASIRQERADGSEFWSARELMSLLGYDTWRNFAESIERARAACDNSGQDSRHHFVAASKLIVAGKGAEREVLDYRLTRYACYLVAMNGDPRKAEIASAQTYFAVRTHQAEQFEAAQAAAPAPALPADPVLAQLETLMAVRRDQLALESRTSHIEQATHQLQERLDNSPIRMYPDKEGRIKSLCQQFGRVHPKGYSGAYRAFYEALGFQGAPLARYDSLPACRFQEAVEWLQVQIRIFSAQRPLMNEASD